MKFKIILSLFFVLMTLSLVLALNPTPTPQDNSHWKQIKFDGLQLANFNLTVTELSPTKIKICLSPKIPRSINDPIMQENRAYLFRNNVQQSIVQPSDFERETEAGKVKKICLDVNSNNYNKVQIGSSTIIYEWIDSTLYIYPTDTFEIEPFTIEAYCNDVKLQQPDFSWQSLDSEIGTGVKFSGRISNFTCNGKLTFKQNKREKVIYNPSNIFYSETDVKEINYDDFESSLGNNIVSKNIEVINPSIWECLVENDFIFVWELKSCLNTIKNYDINYYGNFTDLDPALTEVLSASSMGYFNQTEATVLGVRLKKNTTAVYPSGFYNYTQGDYKSLVFYNSTSQYWNNTLDWADSNGENKVKNLCTNNVNCISYWGLDANYLDSKGGNHGTPTGTNNATGISSPSILFNGINDHINFSSANMQVQFPVSLSAWFNRKDSTAMPIFANDATCDAYWGVWASIGTGIGASYGNGGVLDSTGRYTFSGTYSVSSNQWYHLAVNWINKTTTDVYLNGVKLSGTYSGTANTLNYSANPIGVLGMRDVTGTSGCANAGYANGTIDEVSFFNKSLSTSEITSLYKAGLSQHANTNITLQTRTANSYNISDVGLVGLWGLNGNANDEKGINNGVISGATSTPNGTIGGAYNFDGASNEISLGVINLSTWNQVSISAWIYASDLTAGRRAVTIKHSGSDDIRIFAGAGNTLSFAVDDGTANTASTPAISLNTWYHITGTFNGSKTTIYLNGAEGTPDNSGTFNFATANGSAYIGSLSSSNYWSGRVDEVRIYNRSLSQAEVQDLYELGMTHIEWGEWTTQDRLIKYTKEQGSNTSGKFYQFGTQLKTNDTISSPYLLNYSIKTGSSWSPFNYQNPVVTNVYPITTQSSINLAINYTLITFTEPPEKCWYSLDGGITNSTTVNAGVNFTGVTFAVGQNNYTTYCNDTEGYVGSDTDTFTVDLPPTITINSPPEGSTQSLVFPLNISCTDAIGTGAIWYMWKGVNYTYTNVLDLYASAGSQSLTGYCNDTFGSVVSLARSFSTRDYDTNVSTFCTGGQVLLANGSCGIYFGNQTYVPPASSGTATGGFLYDNPKLPKLI